MIIFTILIFFLLPSFSFAYQALPKIIAAQISYLDLKNLVQVDKFFYKLKKSNINTIIFRVFHNPGDRYHALLSLENSKKVEGVYFKTSYLPVIDDLLSKIIPIAKKYHLNFFAWMTTRDASYGLKDKEKLLDLKYNISLKKMETTKGLNLFSSKVVNILKGVYRDLASYPIDGILFQDDFVYRYNEGFSNEALSYYTKFSSKKFSPDEIFKKENPFYGYKPIFYEWCKLKNKRIMQVASFLMESARSVNPSIKFILNLSYESVLFPKNSLAWLSEDLKTSLNYGFDYYGIMAYHRQIMNELNLNFKEVKKLLSNIMLRSTSLISGENRILIKLQTCDWIKKEKISTKEINSIITTITKGFSPSLSFFPINDSTNLNFLRMFKQKNF